MAKQSVKKRATSAYLRIPGFNAEASLYSSPTAYRAVAVAVKRPWDTERERT